MSLKEQEFETRVNHTLEKIKLLLITKGKEYRRENNPFHNFERGSLMTNEPREKVLKGFLLKHVISVDDMINDLDKEILPQEAQVEEKFNDILVYYLIQKCMILDRLENKKPTN
jgi:hypothetical protein